MARPNGEGIGLGSYNSLILALANKSSLSAGTKIFAEFTMRILDQVNGRHPSAKRNCHLQLVCLFVCMFFAIKSSFDKTSGVIKGQVLKQDI